MKKISGLLKALVWMTALLVLPAHPGRAQTEKILDYHSRIEIQSDGSMLVTETIKVIAADEEIQRGIYRTFPTKYKDRNGNTIRVLFEVVNVLKNGETEPWHTENMSNGVKVYIGSADVYLDPGEYTYTLAYRTDHQLGFFPDYDELYWNVTGLDWVFVIDRVEVEVVLPPGAEVMQTAAYTGPKGAQGQDFTSEILPDGAVRFATTVPLNSYEGLTIAVGFTKGVIPEPTLKDKAGFIIKSNPSLPIALVGLILLFIYYYSSWLSVGKDPSKGTIIPQFIPPKEYTPAAVRYVMRMGYSHRVFAAAIINLAVKGVLKIQEEKGKYTLLRTDWQDAKLDSGEKQLMKKLFSSRNEIDLEQRNHTAIGGAIDALKKDLKLNFAKLNFRLNSNYLVPGILFTLLVLVGIVLFSPEKAAAAGISFWLTGWTAGTSFLVFGAVQEWKDAISAKSGIGCKSIGMTLFALPFVFFEFMGLGFFSLIISPLVAIIFMALVVMNVIFWELLKAPTIYGRRMMDQIEGFKMYLKTAEEHRLNLLHPPDKTPALFEKYLPYALALDVENEWSKKFTDILAGAGVDNGYTPTWYSGSLLNNMGFNGLASSLGSSFSSAISSSSTAPGSSSGSGGGGSSGGGGGGGGGGGW
ncbi:MAG TPA: DUF2207 domain-containing protein [bacterium]|nr:DUF2207 domain-containing protein [bacterium]HPN42294.1 DUF2207 domain-containing protein [bacterium]